MSFILDACRIAVMTDATSNHFNGVLASLVYQAERLGIVVDVFEAIATTNTLSLQFIVPTLELITCDVSAWADDKMRPVSEDLFQAAAGIMSVHGRSKSAAMALGIDYVSTLTAVSALTSLMATAVGQIRGSRLRSIDLSMSSVALLGVSQYIADASVLNTGDVLLPGNKVNLLCPPFVSSDQILFELETLDAEPWLHFWQKLNVDNQLAGRAWKAFQLRYAKAISPLPSELFTVLAHKTYTDIQNLCKKTGVSVSRVVSLEEHAAIPATKSSWKSGPWGFSNIKNCSPNQVNASSGCLPLAGIKVIESCRRIQGPLAGHLLALLGADVIRIEPPSGDPLRGMPPIVNGCSARFSALNRLKETREINIKSAEGHAQIFDLVKNAQVFLHNWAPGKDVELGLDHVALAVITPEIIYGCASGWGNHTQVIDIPGTDFMAQAYSGVAAEISKASGSNGGSLFTVLDSLGGAVAAQGIVAGLLQRHVNNCGCKVETSLLGSAHLLMQRKLGEIYKYNSIMSKHSSSYTKIYDTSHGLLALDIGDNEIKQHLLKLLDISPNTQDIDLNIARILHGDSAKNWQALFDRAHIPAAIVTENLQDIKNDLRFHASVKDSSYLHILSPWSFQ